MTSIRATHLFREEKAVSPVIGTILLVAITVILAAVLGTYVLGMGDEVRESGPMTDLEISDAEAEYTDSDGTDNPVQIFAITHYGGANIDVDTLKIVVRSAPDNVAQLTWDDLSTAQGSPADNIVILDGTQIAGGERFSGGNKMVIRDTGDQSLELTQGDEYVVQVIHKPSNTMVGERSVTLY